MRIKEARKDETRWVWVSDCKVCMAIDVLLTFNFDIVFYSMHFRFGVVNAK
jgi:hypothetical protein